MAYRSADKKPRKAAIAAGLVMFLTSKPCKYGHPLERYVRDGKCVTCKRDQVRKALEKRRRTIPDIVNSYAREHYRKDIERSRAKKRDATMRWRDNNRELNRKLDLAAKNAKYATIMGNINGRMATATRRGLQSGKMGKSWRDLVPYSVDELAKHIERQFPRGMGWHNRNLWHIDHIIPLSLFAFQTADDPEFKAAWALSNLRPIWREINLSKNNRRELLI